MVGFSFKECDEGCIPVVAALVYRPFFQTPPKERYHSHRRQILFSTPTEYILRKNIMVKKS